MVYNHRQHPDKIKTAQYIVSREDIEIEKNTPCVHCIFVRMKKPFVKWTIIDDKL